MPATSFLKDLPNLEIEPGIVYPANRMTKEELIQFEQEIADLYCDAKIMAPIHLSGGNEDQLLEIFKKIDPGDWVFSTWRSHYHALLHGIPPDLVKEEIIKGNSITLSFPKYRFFTSAIVNGIVPIATGVALGLKRKGEKKHVWCFVGDMAAEGGIFYECTKYAANHELPITYVVEDNDLSVGTPTDGAWGYDKKKKDPDYASRSNVIRYVYERKWPHAGAGKWVTF